MASTNKIQKSITWAEAFISFQPLEIGGLDPAIINANIVKQAILGPPFIWAWNRAVVDPINVVAGTQDYVVSLPMWGFIEQAAIEDDDEKLYEVTVKSRLSRSTEKERPTHISVHLDDNAGNITFRLFPCPDEPYTLLIDYQQKAVLIDSPGSQWWPIPDEQSFIYNNGFLAAGMAIAGDNRFPIYNDRFIAHLLSAQDGLDEMQRNIFLGNWLDIMKQLQRSQIMPSQGAAARTK